jgi:N-acetylglucosamine malate deacetylase 1
VLTASPVDYLCDHETTSALVRDACFCAPMPNYRTGGDAAPLQRIPHLYWMDPLTGRDREGCVVAPEFVVDVSATFPTKVAMLSAHASQREWLTRHHGTDDYLLEMERWTRERGEPAGAAYGEGFRQYRGHAYPRTAVLQEAVR